MRILPWLLLLVLVGPVRATLPVQEVEVPCPVCPARVRAVVVLESDRTGGQDRDFMEWSRGPMALFLRPLTCPDCSFSADRVRGFHVEPAQEVVLKVQERGLPSGWKPIEPNSKERLRYGHGFESSQTVPVRLRLRLAAQQSDWAQEPALQRALKWQQVAWAARLEENPFTEPLNEVPDEMFKPLFHRLEQGKTDQAEVEVAWGRELMREARTLEGDKQRRTLILAGFMLRRHGEFHELEQSAELLRTVLGTAFQESLAASIRGEREDLLRSLAALKEGLESAEEGPPPGVRWYLKGELERRSGRYEQAEASYQRALESSELPPELRVWATEQLALVSK